jgi:hypothetical protein
MQSGIFTGQQQTASDLGAASVQCPFCKHDETKDHSIHVPARIFPSAGAVNVAIGEPPVHDLTNGSKNRPSA